MKRRCFRYLFLAGILCLLWSGKPMAVLASESGTSTSVTAGWYEKKGKTYYRMADGTTLTKKGLQQIGKYWYYLNKDGSRHAGFKKIQGKYYYFKVSNGRRYEKSGWKKIEKKTYYFQKDYSVAVGVTKIGKKLYSFTKKGVLERNKKPFKYKKKWVRTDSSGVIQKMSAAQARCSLETWKFINKHSKASQSNAARFRACFNWLEANMPFHYRSFNSKNFQGSDWPYKLAYQMFHYRDGDCHHFACCVASIAKELGYEPYVIVTTGDHSFVEIDGRYYDNMGARFGASGPALKDWSTYKRKKF